MSNSPKSKFGQNTLIALISALAGLFLLFELAISVLFGSDEFSGAHILIFLLGPVAVSLSWHAARRLLRQKEGSRGPLLTLAGLCVCFALFLAITSALLSPGLAQPDRKASHLFGMALATIGLALPLMRLKQQLSNARRGGNIHSDP